MHSILTAELDITDLRVAILAKLNELVNSKQHDKLLLGINKGKDNEVLAGFVISDSLIREAVLLMARNKLGDKITNGSSKTEFTFSEKGDVTGAKVHFKFNPIGE